MGTFWAVCSRHICWAQSASAGCPQGPCPSWVPVTECWGGGCVKSQKRWLFHSPPWWLFHSPPSLPATAEISHGQMVTSRGNLQRAKVGLTERCNEDLLLCVFPELFSIYFSILKGVFLLYRHVLPQCWKREFIPNCETKTSPSFNHMFLFPPSCLNTVILNTVRYVQVLSNYFSRGGERPACFSVFKCVCEICGC